MNTYSVLFFLLIFQQSNKPVIKDPWFSPDKLKHFSISYCIAQFIYQTGYKKFSYSKEKARVFSISVPLLLSIGKEIYDYKKKKLFSYKDLSYSIFGLTLAFFLFPS